MIISDDIEHINYADAIARLPAKSYRLTRNGKYETFVSDRCKSKSIGTYDLESEAKQAVLDYRCSRFEKCVTEYGNDPNDGVVVRKDYVVFPSGDIFNLHGKKMIGSVDRDGYYQLMLNGSIERVHRAVAMSFIDNTDHKHDVNHKNGIKTDNRVENLEWCTRSENIQHAFDTGLEKRQSGELHHAHKLTEDAVRYARSVYKPHSRQFGATAIGKQFGVDRTTVEGAIKGKTWRHVI